MNEKELHATCPHMSSFVLSSINPKLFLHSCLFYQIVKLTGNLLRTGDRGVIKFKFMYNPEYITLGMPLLFR